MFQCLRKIDRGNLNPKDWGEPTVILKSPRRGIKTGQERGSYTDSKTVNRVRGSIRSGQVRAMY